MKYINRDVRNLKITYFYLLVWKEVGFQVLYNQPVRTLSLFELMQFPCDFFN